MTTRHLVPVIVSVVLATALVAILVGPSLAAAPAPHPVLAPLDTVAVPEPPNLAEFVRDKQAAIALGKALYWDMQVGSDGIQACATCHFAAGADPRSKNQLNPGTLGGHTEFAGTPGPNGELHAADFPFHKLADPGDASSAVLSDTTAVTSSQGTIATRFGGVVPGAAAETAEAHPHDPTFGLGGVNTRRVSPRNAPSTINAVFNYRQFWDGRAQNDFNGVNPFGSRDPSARVLEAPAPGQLELVQISLSNASLASQAVGPVTKSEMSYDGRTFRDLARKLFTLRPLARQEVSSTDSVLGELAATPRGLTATYPELIQKAFEPRWWSSDLVVRVAPEGTTFEHPPAGALAPNEFTMTEYNFSLFFGLAIDLYESTLVSDQTPVDKFLGGNASALTAEQKQGFDVFQNGGKCSNCHGGPELTNASVENVESQPLESMEMGDGLPATYDNGFYNIGVRPTEDDKGLGGNDPFGKPLSMSRLAASTGRVVADGAFKVPGLRNVALTAPYFHNGGQATLRQVVDFYSRGGDFAVHNAANFDVDVASIGLSDKEKDELVAFLDGLTDPRVATQSAPFDHPQLFVPNGHPTDANGIATDGGAARDEFLLVPAVGRDGGIQVPTFLNFTGPPVELPSPSAAIPQRTPEATAPPQDAPSAGTGSDPVAAAPAPAPAPAAATGPVSAQHPRWIRLHATRRRGVLVVAATLFVDRPGTVRVSVAHAARLPLLRGSKVGDVVAGRPHGELRVAATRPGPIALRLRIRRLPLRGPQTYRLVAAVEDGGGTGDVAVTFRR